MEMKERYIMLRNKVAVWREEHFKSKVLPVVRFLFGFGVFYKMLEFVHDGGAKISNIMYNTNGLISWIFAYWVPLLLMAASILIFVGLLTRLSSWVVLPIFLGGMILGGHGAFSAFEQSHFLLSLVLFLGSVFFIIVGSGYYSADRALVDETKREEEFYWRE